MFDLRKLLGTIGNEAGQAVGNIAKGAANFSPATQAGQGLGRAVAGALTGGAAQQVINEPRRLPMEMMKPMLPMKSMQPQMMKMPMSAGGLLPRQQQMQQGGQMPGYMQQSMYNDAANFNYPGTMHAEQEIPGFDVNYYTNPNSMYQRRTGSYPTSPYGNNQ